MKLKIKLLSFVLLMSFASVQTFAAFPIQKTTTKIQTEQNLNLKKDVSSSTQTSEGTGKSQLVALILVLFLGTFGVHRFYLGYIWQGVVQLLTLGLFGIWTLIDLIFIITGKLQPKDGPYEDTF